MGLDAGANVVMHLIRLDILDLQIFLEFECWKSRESFSFCKGQRLVGCGEFPQVAIFKAATQGTCDGYPSMDGHCHTHRNDLHWHGVILKNFLKNGFVYLFPLICFFAFVEFHVVSRCTAQDSNSCDLFFTKVTLRHLWRHHVNLERAFDKGQRNVV